MINQLSAVVAVLLAGAAVGAMISGPSTGLRRLGTSAHRSGAPPGGSPQRGSGAVAGLFAPRPGSLPAGHRKAFGLAAAVVVPLGLQALTGIGPIAWCAAPAAGIAAYLLACRLEAPGARRRRQQLVDELPTALDLLSAAIAAGLPLRSAVRELVDVSEGPLAEDLRGVIAGIDLGRNDAEAWRSLGDHPALGPVSVDLARSVQSGTMIAAALQRHAAIARRDRRGEREARARTVGVRSVPPLMLCFVPAFLLISIVPIVASGILQALR
jgi:Flp pilus assembly protein TadB